MSRPTRILSWSLALLGLFVITSGCGQSSFVGRKYDDFTAYYNTFYNAEKAYREGVKALETADQRIDRRLYLSVFPTPDRASGKQFLDAVNKSADVLRKHPDSKWVDDALLLIGQSYFYQQNFVGAEQKFKEVINLGSTLEDEARLWLARTLIAAGAYDDARDHLTLSLAREDLSPRWAPLLHLALGELHVKLGAYEDAALELEAGIEDVRDNALEARAWFLLGQVLETLERYEQAADAFERVAHAHPRYELSYAAQYSAVRVKGIYLDANAALRDLRRMERDDKNYSYRFELAYLKARIYQAEGYWADARDLYEEILYDSNEQIGDVRGRIHYALGELYRDDYRDFLLASAHFDTARTALGSTPVPGTASRTLLQHAPEAITDADQQAQMFRSFASVRTEIARADSLLHLGRLDDEAFEATILEIRRKMARELAEQRKRAEELQAERGFQAAGLDPNTRSAQTPQASGSSEAGFLFHRDPVRVQEARMNFISLWGERPHAPKWRRLHDVMGSTASADASGDNLPMPIRQNNPGVGEEPLPPLDYSNVPRDSLSQAAMRAERALARYELANVLFLAMNRPDSAAAWYRLVIEEDDEEDVAQRAFYALAEVHRSLGDSASARGLYEQVLREYPESDFAGRVREQLGIQADVPSDTLAMAMDAYDRASERWGMRRYRDAFNRMVAIAAGFKRTEAAPKALLAAGQIYLEWSASDSLDIFGPLPVSLEDSLLQSSGVLEAIVERRIIRHEPEPEESTAEVPDNEPGAAEDDTSNDDLSPASEEAIEEGIDDAIEEASDDAIEEASDPSEEPGSSEAEPDVAVGGRLATPPKKGDALSRSVPAESIPAPARGTSEDLGAPPAETTEDFGPPAPSEDEEGSGFDETAEDFQDPDRVVTDTLEVISEPEIDEPEDRLPVDDVASVPPEAVSDSLLRGAAAADTTLNGPPAEAGLRGAAAADTTLNGLPAEAGEEVREPVVEEVVQEVVEEVVEEVNLLSLYAGVKTLYPNTPYAAQAARLQSALQDRKRELEARADSLARQLESERLARAPADSISNAVVDSLEAGLAEGLSDSTAEEDLLAAADGFEIGDATVQDSASSRERVPDPALSRGLPDTAASDGGTGIPAGEAAMRGEGGIRQELGGFTLIIGINVNPEPMEELVEKYAERGFRTDLLVETAGGTTIYRAALGHFATQREAGMALNQYISQIEESAQLAPLLPVQQ